MLYAPRCATESCTTTACYGDIEDVLEDTVSATVVEIATEDITVVSAGCTGATSVAVDATTSENMSSAFMVDMCMNGDAPVVHGSGPRRSASMGGFVAEEEAMKAAPAAAVEEANAAEDIS
jgi:hypothetical protein